ncbi:NF038122 family metalloprotease [Bradyrhizobium sp. CB2312]|uniref:NF038122 family metalloprotease n=1 Tax=Bradyrhizobium sp. CB2312 TaxID=3039155 RepID=UPI0024B05A8B|nr:NF038122 family metalloprotease [Bradyrhizobium sp. CB2312]WFU70611.1 NF038122 family metalloprotease [Bradyrhizobium sp. CB2312]
MIINLDYDSSVNAAPAQFKIALDAAVSYLDSLITSSIAVTFQIGWGENEGVALGSIIANGAPRGGMGYSYNDLVNALRSHATTSVDNLAYSYLPTIDPTNGGQFYVGGAQEKALGLLAANSTEIDGTIGFGATQNWDFDPTNGIGSGQIDFNGVALHELTHALGRIAGLQYALGWYESLDLFRYQAAGQLQLVDHQPAYFSIDGGLTDLKNFDTAQDSADWSDDGIPDSFGYGYSGEVLPISDTDLKVLDVLGYTLSLGLNNPPVAHSDTNGVAKGATISISAAKGVLANDTDPDSNDHLAVLAVSGKASAVGHAIKGEYGSLALNIDGSYTYVADHHAHDHHSQDDHYHGFEQQQGIAQDVFTYTVSDGHGGTSSATLTIVVFDRGTTYLSGTNTTLTAGKGHYVLDGSAGGDTLIAGKSGSVLIGGPDDTLIAGKGEDTFLFRPDFGTDTIKNFNTHQDTLQFDDGIFHGLRDILAHTADSPSGAVISDGHGDSVTLFGVTSAQLHHDDFHLVA